MNSGNNSLFIAPSDRLRTARIISWGGGLRVLIVATLGLCSAAGLSASPIFLEGYAGKESDAACYDGWDGEHMGNATMGVYTRGGSVLFTAATTGWSHGLRGGDPVVERITRNVMDRLSR